MFWTEHKGQDHTLFLKPHAPEFIRLAYFLPRTANKCFPLLCYFDACQNGACKWTVSVELAMH